MTHRSTTHRAARLRALLAGTAVVLATGCAFQAAWIPLKAQAAQLLLARAWSKASEGQPRARPWPWADTWPVARLRVPAHDVDLIVLAGSNGRTLAFAPGHVNGTALPGADGNCVLSGHRDTHFAVLRHVLPGEQMTLETAAGVVRTFRVTARHIVYDSDVEVLDDDGAVTLTLLTCYPFDSLVPGGPLRYVVRAEPVEV
jgi:sortase A